MNKRILAPFALIFLMAPLTSCNQTTSFNMNDQVCADYLSATTSKTQFKAIYPNISSITEKDHDNSLPYKMKCTSNGSNLYYFHVANNSKFDNEEIISTATSELSYDNLIPGKTYYWKVYGDKSDKVLKSGQFIVNKNNVRWINVPSVGNFRDLGGWDLPSGKQIKFNKLFRGRNPDSISNEDKDILKNKLKIKTQIDLRKDNDSGHPGDLAYAIADKDYYYYYNEMLAYDDVIERINEPLRGPCINPNPDLDGHTLNGAQMFKNIFETLANPDNYPVYFHCSAGADRTGSLAFLIEGLLGVSEEDMTRDYELTSFSTKVKGGRLRREPNKDKNDFDYSKQYYLVYDHDPPSITHWPLLIDETKVYGDNLSNAVENFLKNKCEISQETLNQVKANLIE